MLLRLLARLAPPDLPGLDVLRLSGMALLAGAGLLVRSLERLMSIHLGYRAEHLAIVTLVRPVTQDSAAAALTRMYERVAPALRALPGVVALTPVDADPFYGPQVFTARWAAQDQSHADALANPLIPWEVAGEEYFRTFDVPLLSGPGLLATDVADEPRVAVVSRAVARRFWPGDDPVGKQLRLVGDTSATPWVTVVGVAGDIRYRMLREATPTVYLPWQQWFFQGVVAIRTNGPLAPLLPALREAVRAADPEASIARAAPMDALVAQQRALSRGSTLLLSAFGLSALVLAAIALFGVMAAAVRERTHELGVRAALGATPARLRAEVLREAGTITAGRAAIGLAGALAASRWLRELLYEVSPTDPLALAGAAVLLFAVALAAAWVPAWRATHAHPMRALSAE